MIVNEKSVLYSTLQSKITELRDYFEDITLDKVVKYMFQPTDPSSLGVIRFLFGLLMLMDISEERGGSEIDVRWGNPKICHFPLFDFMKPPGFPYMGLMYGLMWLGALGIMLGYKFNLSTVLFGIPYWYVLLLDKSFWNNHSYLFGVVTILLMGCSANNYLSLDAYFDESKQNAHVPYWNYFILKYQFFMLYFLAGLKKGNMEWLEGYSMTNLGTHWVFIPFKILLTESQIDFLVVHWFGFILDLTIGFWMLLEYTRPVAMVFCALFHLMNSRLFSIGMFPYVCLATMPLFCKEYWPRKIPRLFSKVRTPRTALKPSKWCIYHKEGLNEKENLKTEVGWRHRIVTLLLLTHCGLQVFLPYSHFITKGYNNWTKGLYGYSWDMMVHSWDTVLVVVKVVDNQSGEEHFVDPQAYTLNDRWNKHADMSLQYAGCLRDNLMKDSQVVYKEHSSHSSTNTLRQDLPSISPNMSIYIDVWCSLNERFQQRMYNPNYDLLRARWSPFEPVEWLLPLLTSYSDLRRRMREITKDVFTWSNYSDVLFVADFPGMFLENYVNEDLSNVTLTVIEGEVFYEIEDDHAGQSFGLKLRKGSSYPVETGIFHRVHTISEGPSCYMYTFLNTSLEFVQERREVSTRSKTAGMYSPFPLVEEMPQRMDNFLQMMKHIFKSLSCLLFG